MPTARSRPLRPIATAVALATALATPLAVDVLAPTAASAAPPVATFTVTTTSDLPDAAPGNGTCATSAGLCSLRAAVQEGNATAGAGPVVVNVPNTDHPLTRTGTDDAAAFGDLDLLRAFHLVGTGATSTSLPRVTASASVVDRLIDVRPGGSLRLQSIELRNGRAAGGGAIRNDGATLYVIGSALTNNVSTTDGGAVTSSASQVLLDRTAVSGNQAQTAAAVRAPSGTIARSSIHGNTANSAQGVVTFTGTALSVIHSSTVGGNHGRGSVVLLGGQTILVDVTVHDNTTGTGNTAPVLKLTGTGSATMRNSIVSGPGQAGACSAPLTSGGGNLETGTSCGFTAAGDVQSTDPALGPLSDPFAQRLRHYRPRIGPSLDAGAGCMAGDQVDAPRPADADGNGTVVCDRGAVEVPTFPSVITVATNADVGDPNPGDGLCGTQGLFPLCSLRAAVQESNATPVDETIRLPATMTHTIGSSGPGEDAGARGDFDLTDSATIEPEEAGTVARVDVDTLDRVFDVHPGPGGAATVVTLNRLDLRDGAVGGGDGGGIVRVRAGAEVRIVDSMVRGGSAATGSGGGVLAEGLARITRSSVLDNTAASGGGVATAGTGSALVTSSTLTLNQASSGSALHAAAGTLAGVTDTTIVANAGGPGVTAVGTVFVQNSILSNHPGGGCSGPLTSFGTNLSADTTCGLTGSGDVQGVDPVLSTLISDGGTVAGYLPLPGSPAIGTGLTSVPTDQDGQPRPQAPAFCDKGALEVT